MRTSDRKVNKILKRQIENTFNQLIVDIKDTNEAQQILESIMTEKEYETLTKRLAIGYWLKKGRSYQNVKDNLKVSSATIANVQSLSKTKGFEAALKKVEAEEWANLWASRIKKIVNK